MDNLITPKEAMAILHMSRASITECVNLGAPVHRWGPSGRRYMINPDEFIAWMHEHGCQSQEKRNRRKIHLPQEENIVSISAAQMAQKRRDMVAAFTRKTQRA